MTKGHIGITTLAISVWLAASPTSAQGICNQWDLSGNWQAIQSNGYKPQFSLTQKGTELQGSVRYSKVEPNCAKTATCPIITGSADGSIRGGAFNLNVYWKDGKIGVYSGTVGPQGRLLGNTYDQKTPTSTASFNSSRTMTCVDRNSGSSTTQSKPGGASTPPPPQGSNMPDRPSKILGKRPTGQTSAICKQGYVWREARPNDLVCVTPASRARAAQENQVAASRRQPGGGAYGPNTCRQGFVWREAFTGDLVCVTPDIRTLVKQENASAAQTRVGP